MRIHWCAFMGLVIGGCVSANSMGTMAESNQNVTNLARLSIGMDTAEVLCIMKQPYTQETIELKGDRYDVWFYVTMPTAMGQSRMVSANLTPLTFKNGKLVSMGNDYYKWLLKQEKLASKPTVPEGQPQEPMQPLEDKDLEKTLEQQQQQSQAKPKKTALSMSSKPKKEANPDEEQEAKPQKKSPLNESDQEMLEDEGEQNFDFW